MRRYDLGDTAVVRREIRDANGELVDATATLTVTLPGEDTPEAPIAAESVSTGVVEARITGLGAYGVYGYVWTVTGAVSDVSRGRFYVADDDDRLPPLASLDRLGNKLGYTPEGGEADRAAGALDDASELIRGIAGKTWVTEATGALEVIPRAIVNICVAAAYRSFGNPEGLSQRSIGDSTKTWDRKGREGSEDVYLTADEEKRIRQAAEGRSSLTSVTLVSPYNGTILDDDGELIWA